MSKISQLGIITGTETANNDLFVVVDVSRGDEGTKNITRYELVQAIQKETFDAINIIGGDATNIDLYNPYFKSLTTFGGDVSDTDKFIMKRAYDGETVGVSYQDLINNVNNDLAIQIEEDTTNSPRYITFVTGSGNTHNEYISSSNLYFTPATGVLSVKSMKVFGTGSLKIPVGNNSQRTSPPANGMIRYNSELKLYEGYDETKTEWGVLGGTNLTFDETASNLKLLFSAQSEDGVISDVFASNSIFVDTINSTIHSGSFNASGVDAIKISVGSNGERPLYPEAGMLRFNSDSSKFEGYNGFDWGDIGGIPGISVSNDTTTNSNRYLTYTSATNGNITSVNVTSSKLYFNPSSGTLYATTFNSLSDKNSKTNINQITNSGSIIDQLSGVEFNWKEDGSKSSGVIAQDLEKVLPHLVSTDEAGTKTVNYNGIIAYLIEAIKDLQKRVDEK